jgi:hypothetical protein
VRLRALEAWGRRRTIALQLAARRVLWTRGPEGLGIRHDLNAKDDGRGTGRLTHPFSRGARHDLFALGDKDSRRSSRWPVLSFSNDRRLTRYREAIPARRAGHPDSRGHIYGWQAHAMAGEQAGDPDRPTPPQRLHVGSSECWQALCGKASVDVIQGQRGCIKRKWIRWE